MNDDILQREVTLALEKDLQGFETTVALLKQGLKEAKDRANIKFNVHLRCLWANEGGRDGKAERTRDLEKALKNAVTRYLKINNRSDVQAQWQVTFQLPCGAGGKVPDKVWKPLAIKVLEKYAPSTSSLQRWKGEQ